MISKTKGFTLIELMIVVAIIGIIGAVFFGTLSRMEDRTPTVANNAQLRDIKVRLAEQCPDLKLLVQQSAMDGITHSEYKIFKKKCSVAEKDRLIRELQY